MQEKLNEEQYLLKIYQMINKEHPIPKSEEEKNIAIKWVKQKYPQILILYKQYKNNPIGVSLFELQEYVDLRKMEFFYINRNVPTGDCVDSWIGLSDLKEYMLKRLVSYKVMGKGDVNKILWNSRILPEIINRVGLQSAKYYITTFYEQDQGEEDEFLITPSFLEQGDELVHLKDICGSELEIPAIEKKIQEYLRLRHFSKEQIETLRKEFIKQVFMSKFLANKDENNGNTSIIIGQDNGMRNIKMAPMYDLDFSCGNERLCDCNIERTINKKSDLKSFVNYYKEEEWFSEWIKEKVLTLQINDIHFEKNNNKPNICKETLAQYVRFLDTQKRRIELALENSNTLEEI